MQRALSLSSLLLSVSLAMCQHQITLDLSTGEVEPLHCTLKLDGTVVFKIVNINPFLYQCTIEGNDVFSYSESTGPWTQVVGWMKKPDEVEEGNQQIQEDADARGIDPDKAEEHERIQLQLEAVQKERNDLQVRSSALQSVEYRTVGVKKILADQEPINGLEDGLKQELVSLMIDHQLGGLASETILMQKDLKELVSLFSRTLQAEMQAIQEKMTSNTEQLAELKVKLARLESHPLPRLLGPVREASQQVSGAYKELMRLGDFYNALQGITKNSCLRPNEIMAQVQALEDVHTMSSGPAGVLRGVQDALTNFYDTYDHYLQQWAEVAEEDEKDRAVKVATPVKKAVDRIKKDLDDFDYGAHITTSEQVRSAARLGSTYEAVSVAVQAQGDFVEFSYDIKPRTAESGPCTVTTREGTHKVYVKNGWRVDFGTGLAGVLGIADDSYRLDTDPDIEGNATLVANHGNAPFRPTLAGTVHLSPRCCWQVRPQVMAGLALNMSGLDNGSFFLGIGGLFGRQQLLSVHGGVAFLQADVLRTGLVEGRSYALDAIDATQLVEQQYKQGWFVGISYILTKTDKQK